jgi:hypothetical protein
MLKRFLKNLLGQITLLYFTLFSLLRIVIFSSPSRQIKRLKADPDSECYILGNGPSLKENVLNDLDLLKTKELFVVNDFAKSKYFEILKPKYYVLLDPSYWNSSTYKELFDDCIKVLNTIQDKTDWPMFLMVPTEAHRVSLIKDIFNKNKNITIISFNSTSVTGFQWFRFFAYKNYLGIPPVNNVVGACIYIAINMQYPEINILGADHSWTQDLIVNDKNLVCCVNPHFFDDEDGHYLPHKTVNGNFYTMHRLLRDYALMFEGYHTLRIYAESRKIKILNRCKKSFIDAFERRDLYPG